MPVGRQAFLDYWPIMPPVEEPSRLYRQVRWGKLAEIFILDTRQYRTPSSEIDGPQKSMLGERQRRWLIEGLAASDAVWKIIVSSVTLSVPTGRISRDGWANGDIDLLPQGGGSGYEHELLRIVQALADQRVKNLVWMTADVHHAEIIRHAPRPDLTFFEFIAGPLSASRGRPRVLDQTLKPTRLFAKGDVLNFGQVSIDQLGLTVRIYDDTGTLHFEETFHPQR
jgi:alkaline phosphatase D